MQLRQSDSTQEQREHPATLRLSLEFLLRVVSWQQCVIPTVSYSPAQGTPVGASMPRPPARRSRRALGGSRAASSGGQRPRLWPAVRLGTRRVLPRYVWVALAPRHLPPAPRGPFHPGFPLPGSDHVPGCTPAVPGAVNRGLASRVFPGKGVWQYRGERAWRTRQITRFTIWPEVARRRPGRLRHRGH